MDDVYINFRGSGREGSLAVNTYLLDAAGQLGVDLKCDCAEEEPTNACAVKVSKGFALLSKPTKLEIEQLTASERKEHQRLACQTKIERPGEIEVMTIKKEEAAEEKTKENEQAESADEYRQRFKEMPLNEKISSLVELEAIALGETLSYVINSPYEAFGKVMDAMAVFGRDLEDEDRKSKVPEEHRDEEEDQDAESPKEKKDASKNGRSTRKKSGTKRTAKRKSSTTKARKRGRPAKSKEEDNDRQS